MFADRYLVTSPAHEAHGPAGVARRRAIDARTQAPVELYIWSPPAAADDVAAFRRHARVLEGLRHPHLAAVAGAGVAGEDVPYMALADGGARPLGAGDARRLREALDALAFLHERGLAFGGLPLASFRARADGALVLVGVPLAVLPDDGAMAADLRDLAVWAGTALPGTARALLLARRGRAFGSVGREAETARLAAAIDRAAAGGAGGFKTIAGPAGSGKSRLLAEALALAAAGGLPTRLRAAAGEGPRVPFGALGAAVAGLAQALAGERPQLAEALAALASGGGAPDVAIDAETGRLRQARARRLVLEGLEAALAKGGVLLALDDWHDADAASRDLVATIAARFEAAPLLVLLATRADDPAAALPLGPLPAAAIRRLAAEAGELSGAQLDAVERLAAGSPLAARLAAEALAADPAAAGAEGFEALLDARLAGLDGPARALARAGSLAGERFDAFAAGLVAGLTPAETAAAVHELIVAGLVAAVEGTEDALRFAMPAVRARLLAALAAADVPGLHDAWAGALAGELEAGWPLPRLVAIAHHRLRGADPAAHAATIHAAGRELVAAGDPQAGAALLEAGQNALGAPGADEPKALRRTRQALLASLGDVRRLEGDPKAAVALYEAALAITPADEAVGPGSPGDKLRARTLISIARARQVQGDAPGALAACDDAMALLDAGRDQAEAARCLLTGARIRFFRGEAPRALVDAERALARAREAGDRRREGEALALYGYLAATSGTTSRPEGQGHLEAAIAILDAEGDQHGQMNALSLLGNVLGARGESRAAAEAFRGVLAAARATGDLPEEAGARINLADQLFEAGAAEDALAESRAGAALATRAGNRYLLALAALVEALALADLGKPVEAWHVMAFAGSLAEAVQRPYLTRHALTYRAELALATGRHTEALAAAEEALALDREARDEIGAARTAAIVAAATAALGEREAAIAQATKALVMADLAGATGVARRVRGIMAQLGPGGIKGAPAYDA